jgi:hypothetical protein
MEKNLKRVIIRVIWVYPESRSYQVHFSQQNLGNLFTNTLSYIPNS